MFYATGYVTDVPGYTLGLEFELEFEFEHVE